MSERIHRSDHRVTRRAFLARAAGLGGALALSKILGGGEKPEPANLLNERVATPGVVIEPITKETLPSGVVVTFNKEGLPLNCTLSGGESIQFDTFEMRLMRERALLSQQPEIVDVQRLPGVGRNNQGPKVGEDIIRSRRSFTQTNPELHPLTRELPQDVVSGTELYGRGIKIVQSDNTRLYIRRGAFESGEPLSAFGDSGRKLTIALLDTPVVSEFGLEGYKYDEVRHVLTDHRTKHASEVQRYRNEEMNAAVAVLNNIHRAVAEQEMESGPVNKESGLNWIEEAVLYAKQKPFLFNLMNKKEILSLAVSREMVPVEVMGAYCRPASNTDPAVIFLAVGSNVPDVSTITFYFTPRGEFKAKELNISDLAGINRTPSAPRKDQTHPDPKNFAATFIASVFPIDYYPFGAQTPGQSLRHEVSHDKLIMQGEQANEREYDTDIDAMKGIDAAWQRWVNSGYTDNTGYYYVFSLPEGGYILTRSKQSDQKLHNT